MKTKLPQPLTIHPSVVVALESRGLSKKLPDGTLWCEVWLWWEGIEVSRMSSTEEELLVKAVAGDTDALSDLLGSVGPQVEAGLDGKIAKHNQAAFDPADVMQVTYLEAFLRFSRFEPTGSVGSFVRWLERIAQNNLLDAVRALDREKRPPRRKKLTRVQQDGTYVTLLGNLTGTTGTPSRQVAQSEAKQLLERALAKLPRDYERVVRELDLEEHSPGEVAESLGRSKGAVHMLRARAHERLQELLGSPSQFFTDSP